MSKTATVKCWFAVINQTSSKPLKIRYVSLLANNCSLFVNFDTDKNVINCQHWSVLPIFETLVSFWKFPYKIPTIYFQTNNKISLIIDHLLCFWLKVNLLSRIFYWSKILCENNIINSSWIVNLAKIFCILDLIVNC